MKKVFILGCVMAGLLSSCAMQKKNEQNEGGRLCTPEAQQMLAVLTHASEKGFMFGHQDATVYGIGWEGDKERSDVKSVCGDYPAIIGFDLGEVEIGNTSNLDKVPFNRIREEAINQYQRGGLVTLSWHTRNPLTGGDAWDVKDSTVVKSILEGGELHKKFMDWLDNVAGFISSLKTKDGTKVPVLFRPWHEHTGSWFWWGKDLCSPEEYKALWKMTYTYFQDKGVDNVLYAYSPGGCTSKEEYMERYPGDEYVDLLGFDYYQMSADDPESFTKSMKECLDVLTALGQEHKKPVAVTETGLNTIPVKDWWTSVLSPILKDYAVSYVLVWRNAREKENHYYGPYPQQASADDFVEFYNDSRTLFLNDVKNIKK